MRKPDACLFENRAISQDATLAAAALGTTPRILFKFGGTVRRFDRCADSILQLA
jgi:hypothetical protein